MRSKLKVQLPQVLNKTQASYQHHMLDMLSQLVRQQKQNNQLLKSATGNQPTFVNSINPIKKKAQLNSTYQNHRTMLSQDSYLSQTNRKEYTEGSINYRNQGKLHSYTIQDNQCSMIDKQNYLDARSFNNSPRAVRHKQVQQQNILMPASALQTLIKSIGSLEKSINILGNKIETQNKYFDNLAISQERKASQQKQIKKQVYSYHENKLDQVVNQLKTLNYTMKENLSIGNLLKASQPVKLITENSDKNIDKKSLSLIQGNQQFKQEVLAVAQKKETQARRRSRVSQAFNQAIKIQRNTLETLDPIVEMGATQYKNFTSTATDQTNFKNIQQYSRLSQIQPHCDKRQIKVRVSFYEMFTNSDIMKIENKKLFQLYIIQWLGVTYRATASVCWNMLNSRQLSFEEVKILFTQNIIYNFIELMKDVRSLGFQNEQINLVPQIINKKSKNVLDFLCHQYPQTKIEAPNMALRSVIPQKNETGRFEYELVSSSKVSFTLKKSINYSSQIMQFINYLIDVSNKQYNNFENYMLNLFSQLYVPVQMRGTQAAKNVVNSQALSVYQEKVKRYTKIVIGRKISENTPKYTKEQIQIGIFFIKSAKVLRVIAKWAEDLIYVIQNPDTQIRDWFYPFKDHNGNEQQALYAIRKGIYKTILSTRHQIFQKLDSIRKQCYKIQGQLAKVQHISDQDEVFLSEQQTNVGLFASNVKNALSSFLWEQLSHVIHFLLRAPLRTDQKTLELDQFFQINARAQLDSINLVTFRISDLLRCKCVSGESQIIWLVNQLKFLDKNTNQLEDNQKNFTIVRFKDRLNQGTRDILVNARIGTGPVCQIQLSISNQVDEKQQMLDKYNHFLYELKRASLLGPLIENVSIWTSSQQKSSYFDELTLRKFSRGIIVPQVHKCHNVQMEQHTQPMVCMGCQIFFHIPRTCLQNWHCKTCNAKYCGQCFISGMNEKQRKQSFFLSKHNKNAKSSNAMPKEFISMIEEYEYSAGKQIPTYAFFFKKDFLKPELCFMTAYKASQQQQGGGKTKIAETVIRDGKLLNRTLIKNEFEMEKMKNFLIFAFKKPELFQDLTVEEIRVRDFENENKLKITNLMFEPNYLGNIVNVINPKSKEKLLNMIESIIKQRKIKILHIKKQILLVKVAIDTEELQKQLTIKDNLKRVKTFAQANSSAISLEKRNVSIQMKVIAQKLGPLSYQNLCARVQRIYLNFGTMQDIESLRPFYRLRSLYFSNNQVKSLSGIQVIHRLRNICFDKNKIESLEEFKYLKRVEKIMGGDNLIKSLEGIQNLDNLRQLLLNKNKIEKIQFLDNACKLELLYLNENNICKIQNLDSLVNLKKLNLSNNPIQKVENIKVLKNLRGLYLCGLGLKEIPEEIQYLGELTQLYLDDNQIEKISNLNQIEKINDLKQYEKIDKNDKTDKLTKLKVISLQNNKIQVIQNIGHLPIAKIFLDQNKITKISNIKNIMDTIEVFSILKNKIQDVTQLIGSEITFKFIWSKKQFTPEARKMLQRIFRKDQTLVAELSNKNISEFSGGRSEGGGKSEGGDRQEDNNNLGNDD